MPTSKCTGVAVALIGIRVTAMPARRRLRLRSTRPQDLDAGQRLAFQPFEEGAAGGRDIGEIVGDPGMVERRDRVAAAGDREQLAGLRSARGRLLRDGVGARVEGRRARTRRTGRSRPASCACASFDRRRVSTDCGPMSRIMSSGPTASTGTTRVGGMGLELGGHDGVDRQHDLAARLLAPCRGWSGRCRAGPSRRATCRRPCPARPGRCSPCRRR